jgi:hypothetical protein
MINLDETNFQASQGVLRVVGSAEVKKHEKATADSRESVTCIRIGSAAGAQGPWIFLVKGKKPLDKNHPLYGDLHARFPDAPPRSRVFVTPNAYLTDEAWAEIAPIIAQGIRDMPVIRDHPDWKVCCTLDGFSSHLKPASLTPFTEAKIELVKEEGDSSQTNQAYDQQVAKEDKKHVNNALDTIRGTRKLAAGVMKRETIVGACIHALSKVKPETWSSSFKKVNLHPHHRVEFTEWCKKIESKLKTGDLFFKNRVGLFDAMPAFWKKMPEGHRHATVALIDSFYKEAVQQNSDPWTTDNIMKLVKYCSYENIKALRGCYLTTKIDPSVFVEPDRMAEKEAEAKEAAEQNAKLIDNYDFTWKPKVHWDVITGETQRTPAGNLLVPVSREKAEAFFDHINNYVSRRHGAAQKVPRRQRKDLAPAGYLDVEVTDTQLDYLNPPPNDVLVGSIMEDSIGENARKKIAKRRINFINGNVESYSRSLNNPRQLAYIEDANKLSATLSTIEEARLQAKDDTKKRKAEEQKTKKAKKAKSAAAFHKTQKELYEGLKEDVLKGLDHVRKLPKPRLEQLAKYFFEDKTPNRSKMKANELLQLVEKCFQKSQQTQQEA